MRSAEEISANLERADSAPQAFKLFLSSEFLSDAASRAYSSAFHGATALLLPQRLSFGSHAGILRAVSLNFVKIGQLPRSYGRVFNWLAELRHMADRDELFHISVADAERAIAIAEEFLQ